MQKDLIRLIWDIRGKVSEAINNHDSKLYEEAKAEFKNLQESGKIFKTIAMETMAAEYTSEDEREFDIVSNYVVILQNLNELKKDVVGEPREEYDVFLSSVAINIWKSRELFDSFVLNAELGCLEDEENKKHFLAIEENLKIILEYYKFFRGATDIKEKITIIEILREINNAYDKFYTEKLKTDEI